MSLAIVDRSGEMSAEVGEFAERRMRFALSRFDSRIERISVVLGDANGPRGGVDKSCRIRVKLRRAKNGTITDQDADAAACIARAAERVGRSVAHAIERRQQFDRSRTSNADTGTAAIE